MQDKTSILAATTPQDNTTYHAFLLNARDKTTGERLFNVVNLFEVCKSCLAGKTPWKCTHNQDRISASKSKAARDQTLALYRDGQQAVALRELFGQASKNTTNLIPTEHSDLFKKSTVHITDPVRALYIGIDPGGGGPGELGVVGIAETFDNQGTIPGPRLAVSSG